MTPLDFRLIGIPFFRLIGAHCEVSMEAMKSVQGAFRRTQYVSKSLLTTSSFDQQLIKVIGSFRFQVEIQALKASTSSFIVFSLRQSNVYSAFKTNTFQTTVPGSNVYDKIKNIYPLYENASVINVS